MFVGVDSLIAFINRLKTIKAGICKETLSEVNDCLKRGDKFEKMWMDLKCYIHGTKKIDFEIPESYRSIQGGIVKYLMEKIFREHFPLPRKVVEDTPFVKGFKQGMEIAERIAAVRGAVKGVLDEK